MRRIGALLAAAGIIGLLNLLFGPSLDYDFGLDGASNALFGPSIALLVVAGLLTVVHLMRKG